MWTYMQRGLDACPCTVVTTDQTHLMELGHMLHAGMQCRHQPLVMQKKSEEKCISPRCPTKRDVGNA